MTVKRANHVLESTETSTNRQAKSGCPIGLFSAGVGSPQWDLTVVPHNLRRMWTSVKMSRGQQQSWWQGWKGCPWKVANSFGVTEFGEKQAGGDIALYSSLRSGSRDRSWAIFPLYLVMGHVRMSQSCARGGSQQILGSITLLTDWSNSTIFLEVVSRSHGHKYLRGVWTMPLRTCLDFWPALTKVDNHCSYFPSILV